MGERLSGGKHIVDKPKYIKKRIITGKYEVLLVLEAVF